jgi:RNA recognition motif-containing protein
MNIYVGNLGKDVTDEELQNEFAAYGYIKSVKIIRDLFSGESKGFGFVEMPGVAEAQKAIESLNAKELGGKKIVVNEARPKTEGGRGGSRGGGGGSRGGRPGGSGGSRGGRPGGNGGGGRPGGGSRY